MNWIADNQGNFIYNPPQSAFPADTKDRVQALLKKMREEMNAR